MHQAKLIKSLYAITAKKDTKHPSLVGLLYSKGFIIASNAFCIASVKADYSPELEGKIIDAKGKVVAEKALNVDSILPYDPDRTLNTADYALVTNPGEMRQACELLPAPGANGPYNYLDVFGACFPPSQILQLLTIFDNLLDFGETPKIHVKRTGERFTDFRMFLHSPHCIGVIMPVDFGANLQHPNRFTISEALEIGDLL